MTIWRLVKEKYTRVAYGGGGGLRIAGRWHRAGRHVAYASEHAALAILEKLVWLDDDAVQADLSFVLVPLTLDPEQHLDRLSEEALPENWKAANHTAGTREIGTQWLEEGQTPVLSVPSVLLPTARNFLINPLAPAFEELDIGDPVSFTWDPRLFDRPSF